MIATSTSTRRAYWRFAGGTDGSVSILLAVSILVLLCVVGFTIDTARLYSAKAELQSAADSAVLAGVRAGQSAVLNGESDWKKVAKTAAETVFAGNINSPHLKDAKPKFKFKMNKQTISGDGTYDETVKLVLLPILGFKETQIRGETSAVFERPDYIDVAFIVDTSVSMGIGATLADQQLLYNTLFDSASNIGCAFACHLPKNAFEKQFTLERARGTGAKLRIDVVRDAVKNALAKLDGGSNSESVRVSIYTFSNAMREFVAPTTDVQSAINAVSRLDLMPVDAQTPYSGGTNIHNAVMKVRDKLNDYGKAGDGSKADKRKSFVILISDGIEDAQYNRAYSTFPDGTTSYAVSTTPLAGWITNLTSQTYMQVFDPATCNTLKSDKRDVYTVQIRYTIAVKFDDQWWNVPIVKYIEEMRPKIEAAMTACATRSDYHIVAETSEEISPALDGITAQISSGHELYIDK